MKAFGYSPRSTLSLSKYAPTDGSPFPIALACCSAEDAAQFAPIKPFIDAIARRDLQDREKLVEALDKLASNRSAAKILNLEGKFYPVLHGNNGRQGIFMQWYVYILLRALHS